MYKIPINELKEKITASGKLNLEQLDEKIKNKVNELSGLISEEGAAHIIANELGIELVPKGNNKLKIKEIYSGMKNITTVGKVVQKFEVREFAKEDRTGKVCSLILGDETGTIRVVFWNEQVDLLDKVNADDIILVKDSYVRENRDNKEIHLGSQGSMEHNPEGETVGEVRMSSNYERKKINELSGGESNTEIVGTIVQVFDPRFFNVCPECGRKAVESGGGFQCANHGSVQPQLSYVLNAVLDDGTGTIRGVFWKNQTNHLLGKEEAEISEYKDELPKFEDVKTDLLGEQFKLLGRVNKNEMFDRMEFNVQIVEKAKPEEELAKLETVE